MPKDLRTFLDELAEARPDDIKMITDEVDPRFGVTAIAEKLEDEGRIPALYFKNLKGSRMPLVINLTGSYERLALALGATTENMAQVFAEKEANALPLKEVSDAPVKDIIIKGDDVDLGILPITTHNELDAGPYICSGGAITRDPDTGLYNSGIFRMQVYSKNEIAGKFHPMHHSGYLIKKYAEMNENMEVAVVIGHHPAFSLASVSRLPQIGGEMEVAGALMGEPLAVVRGETVDLLVPARAEIVVEGVIVPRVLRDEGPFGEWPGYYLGGQPTPVIKVTAITMRRDAIYYDINAAHAEHRVLGSLPRMARIFRRVKMTVPTVKAVNVPQFCRMHCYISIKKTAGDEGEPKQAAFAALMTEPINLTMVIVVDDDINVFNVADVLWAVGTRFQADRDLTILPNCSGPGGLNPAAYSYDVDGTAHPRMMTKLILDATKPAPPTKYPPKAAVPAEVKARVQLDKLLKDYVKE